ncbi:MAG: hypothetical protein LBG28_01975 [Tannerella sp.]|nr:hypothetical protein [Tannerella sp.]
MKTKILLLLLWTNICYGFSQECPCIKAAIIGTNVNVSVIHNNKVTAMDDTEIKRGESIELQFVKSAGKTTWYHEQQELSNTTVDTKSRRSGEKTISQQSGKETGKPSYQAEISGRFKEGRHSTLKSGISSKDYK